jgi:nucleoid-associated protein YgaU
MFETNSRYYAIETVKMTVTDPAGQPRVIAFKRRRFIAPSAGTVTLVEHTVTRGDRLDMITARYLGDPTQFWRVCDANDVLRPDELTREVGIRIRIALPLL